MRVGPPTEGQVTAFWPVADYRGQAAVVLSRGQPKTPPGWRDERCPRLRHDVAGAETVLKPLRSLAQTRPWAKGDEEVERAITALPTQSKAGRMDG
jgi:hypothetical protein